MNLNPAATEKEYKRRMDAIMLCGRNMGPHDYIPISWIKDEATRTDHVTNLMCRVCFNRVNMKTLYTTFPEVTI